MFLDDLADIDGVSFTLGAGGPGRNVNGSGNDSNPGNAGGTSSFSGGGVTLSATGGGGGGEINFAAGAAGVGTPAEKEEVPPALPGLLSLPEPLTFLPGPPAPSVNESPSISARSSKNIPAKPPVPPGPA